MFASEVFYSFQSLTSTSYSSKYTFDTDAVSELMNSMPLSN
jgi:hypothetical protein